METPRGPGLSGYRPGELRPYPGYPQGALPDLLELPDAWWTEMGQVCRRVAQALQAALRAQGFNIDMNNFEAAGQAVFHAHLHVIPRYHTDGLKLFPQAQL